MKKIVSLLVMLCVGVFAFAGRGDMDYRREVARKLYGRIKISESRGDSDYLVYVSDWAMADLHVFVWKDRGPACRPGNWCFVNDSGVDFRIFFVNSIGEADVYVAFTDSPSSAGPMP